MADEQEDKFVTQRIRKETADRVKAKGKMGESFDDVLSMILDEYDKTVTT